MNYEADKWNFGLINKITKIGPSIWLSVETCTTLGFNEHLHAYSIEGLELEEWIEINTLPSAFPLSVYNDYVSLKHFVRVPTDKNE